MEKPKNTMLKSVKIRRGELGEKNQFDFLRLRISLGSSHSNRRVNINKANFAVKN